MTKQRFASVWDAIEDTPEEAENMKLRSILMTALKNHLTHTEMSQAQAAKLFGVTQPRISDLMRGKINLFGLDALVNMTTAAGNAASPNASMASGKPMLPELVNIIGGTNVRAETFSMRASGHASRPLTRTMTAAPMASFE